MNLKHPIKRITLVVSLYLVSIFSYNKAKAQSDVGVAQININCLSKVDNPKSMVGFLHSVNEQTPAKMIEPLQPSYWRISSKNGNVLSKISMSGAKPIFVLSDLYGYSGAHKSGWTIASDSPTKWEDTVTKTLNLHRQQNRNVIYDIWNEPNGNFFWTGVRQNFFKTFKEAHDRIRATQGGANTLISGPSVSKFDKEYIQAFLDYCLVNNVQLDILSWHEFKAGDQIPEIQADLLWARQNWLNNKKYAPLHIKAIQINEIIPSSDQFIPASILGYFYYLEKGKADAACKACWTESNGKSNCFNNSIDGLLTSDGYLPRAAWWAYKYYNLSLQNRLNSISNNKNLVSFVNYSPQKLSILLGYLSNANDASGNIPIKINLTNVSSLNYFAAKKTVNITITTIPNSGEQALASPAVTYQATANIQNGNLSFTIPQIKMKEGYVIDVN